MAWVCGGADEWHANAATDVDGSAAAAVVLVPFVGTWEVGEAAVGRCDMESADAVGGGDE